jgi:regulator of ribonuclease activity A
MNWLTSDILDAYPDAHVCAIQMYLFGQNPAIFGRIRTIRCFEDNALVAAALCEPSEHEVLVIDGGGSLRTALMGDRLAALGVANGWAGAIVFGAIRDSAVIQTMPFHVKTIGTNPRKSAKVGAGERDIALHFGDIRFVSGHFLASDNDGIVVLSEPPGPRSDPGIEH